MPRTRYSELDHCADRPALPSLKIGARQVEEVVGGKKELRIFVIQQFLSALESALDSIANFIAFWHAQT